MLAGFSQGGAIALHTGLRHAESLAGILALSTYLPLDETLDRESSHANKRVPIFMAHGTQDPIVPLSLAESSRRARRARPVAGVAHLPHAALGVRRGSRGDLAVARGCYASPILAA